MHMATINVATISGVHCTEDAPYLYGFLVDLGPPPGAGILPLHVVALDGRPAVVGRRLPFDRDLFLVAVKYFRFAGLAGTVCGETRRQRVKDELLRVNTFIPPPPS